MEDRDLSLAGLPVELQTQIIRLVDAVGVISLSQASRHFRRLVSPGRGEWTEWLLAAECAPRHAGQDQHQHQHEDQHPVYRLLDDGCLEPSRELAHWEAHRWLCGGCLRLLRHTDFDNHALLRLPFRKPVPGSPAAAAQPTSWEPSIHAQRRASSCSSSSFLSSSSSSSYTRDRPRPAKDTTRTRESAGDALRRHLDSAGYNRRNRRCNECRFQAGQLGPRLSRSDGFMGGTRAAPIQRSRQLMFDSALDRWFPGLPAFLSTSRPAFPPRIVRAHRDDAPDEPWALYMMRCPRCAAWQELRAFRFGGTYVKWKPSHAGDGAVEFYTSLHGDSRVVCLDDARCNHCVLEDEGRAGLAAALLEWCRVSWVLQQWTIEGRLGPWWVERFLRDAEPPGAGAGFGREIRHLARDIARIPNRRAYQLWGYADVAVLRQQHYQAVDIWDRMRRQGGDKGGVAARPETAEFVAKKLRRFHEAEAHWRFLVEGLKELEADPDLLVQWALSQGRGTHSRQSQTNTT